MIVDLFFASSGVETEIVAAADPIEIWPGTVASVATTAHLLALKVLASRPRDFEDFALLRENALADDLKTAREILALIIERGYARDKNLLAMFDDLLSQPSLADVFVERQPAD
ncbi:MAG: hypothetical protein HC897_09230 [Thermoanaerobaculia bacterium]|nr:hypothetical protein [Thermoanaerobaculia bacterium]